MAASFLAVTLLFPRHWPNPALVGLLAGCALATLLGLADELWSLSPWKHFLGQVGVVLVAISIGFPRIQKVSNPLSTTVSLHRSGSISLATLLGFGHAPATVANAVTLVAGILFTVFWIVGVSSRGPRSTSHASSSTQIVSRCAASSRASVSANSRAVASAQRVRSSVSSRRPTGRSGPGR